MIIFFVTNLLIFLSFYLLLINKKLTSISEKLVATVLLTTAQIILSELVLGILEILTVNYLILLNTAIALIIIFIVFRKQRNVKAYLTDDYISLKNNLKSINSPYIIFLFLLLSLVSFWLFLSAILLPPRGIDDLTYHLPAVFEYIYHQKIFLLPVEYRGHVAFPMNAELLFLWPTVFFKNLIPIGLVQFFYGIYGISVIYVLSRQLSLKRETSIFIGLIFFFSPVVLTQAGVAYIDLIVSVLFLVSLYFSIRFYSTQISTYLFLAGISIGLILGMKYTMILTAIILQTVIFPKLIRKNSREILIYFLLISIFSCYWYLRNYLVLGNPVFPMEIFTESREFLSISSLNILYIVNKFKEIFGLFLYDTGIGSFHGGYGIIFWGIAIPSWIYFFIKSIMIKNRSRSVNIFILLQLLTGFLFLFLVPSFKFHRSPRLTIFMIGIGILAVGKLIEEFESQKIYKNTILLSCCVFSFLSTFQLARAKLPSYAIDIPIYDILSKKDYSQMRYLRFASSSSSFLWETLDYITLNYRKGLDCYFASSVLDYAGPIYGSRLQNRVWNFKEDKSKMPDAFIFLIHDEENVKYYGKKITIDEVLNNNNYKLIDLAEKAYLYLHKDFLEKNSIISNSLIRHYENYYDYEIKVASRFKNKVNNGAPIITSSYYGMGFQYLNMIDEINNPVHVLPVDKETQFIENSNITMFYSINKTFKGYDSKVIGKIVFKKNEEIILYFNSKI